MNTRYEIIELGNPVLKIKAEPVSDFDCLSIRRHIDAMLALMNDRQGVGIAAPQLGISLQILIVASRPNERYPDAPSMVPVVMINPQLVWHSTRLVKDWEGCLSVPGIRGLVERPDAVEVAYQDACGQWCEVSWRGFPARIFQHEFDHLLGKTFLDRVHSMNDLYSEKEFLKLRQSADVYKD